VRSISLLRIAAEAERLHLRALMARQARRAVFGTIAAVFGVAVLALAEVVGWQGLRLKVEPILTTLILLGINLVVAVVFGVLTARSVPSHTEQEAMRVRQQALHAARGALAFTAAIPMASRLLRLRRAGNGGRMSRLPFVGG
jgi:hypothetical protein